MMIHRFVGTVARLRSPFGHVAETGYEHEVFHGIVNNVGAADALERKVGRVVDFELQIVENHNSRSTRWKLRICGENRCGNG